MGKVIKKQIQGLSWQMKTSLVLLLTLATSVFMHQGWYKPHLASAAVAVSTQWAILGSSTTTIANLPAMTLAKPATTNRMLVVSFAGDYGTATTTFQPTITYGGQALTRITSTDTSSRQKVWIGYLNDAGITAASSASFAVSGVSPNAGCALSAAYYNGVNQTSPITGSRAVSSDTAATTPTSATIPVTAGGWAIYSLMTNSNTAANASVPAGYTEHFDTANGTLYMFTMGSGTMGTTGTTNPLPVWTSVRYAFLTAALAPAPAPSGDTLTVANNAAIANAASDSATGVVMQRLQLNSNANADGQVVLASLTLDDNTATATSYANAKVYIDSTSSATLPGTAVLIGSQAAFTGGSTVINLTGGTAANRTVTTAAKYLYIVYDMASGQATRTALSRVSAVGVASPDSGATGLALSSNSFTLSSAPITLGSQITSCGGCHGYSTTFNDGSARNIPLGQFQGSHNNHVIAGSMNCAACHTIPAATTSADYPHANGTVNMASPINGDAGAAYSKGSFAVSNAAFTGGTCSSTKCHGTASPAWGNNSAANIDVCTKCHGTKSVSTATDLQKAPTAPATAAHGIHIAGSSIGKLVVCSECHENVVTISTAGHMDGTKTILYNGPIGTAQSTVPSGTYPANCATTWCHGGNTASIPQNKPIARTAPAWGTTFGTTSVLGDALGATSVNTGSGRCAKCHGYPPATSSHTGTSLAGTKPCSQCHANLTTSGAFVTASLHINGTIEGGGSCTSCHDTGGSGLGAGNVRRAITPQFASGNSHHYQGAAAIDGKACYACHWESDASGAQTSYHAGTQGATVDLVVWNATSRPTTYTANVTATTYLSGGAAASSRTEMAKINTHCLGCHNEANKGIATFTGDTGTPAKYSWESLPVNKGGLAGTAQSIAAKYSDTTTTLWGKFAGNYTNTKNTQTKALSAHGNTANQRGWSTLAENQQGTAAVANYPNTSGAVQVLCFDCHNSHGSEASAPANAITTSYSSATGRGKGGILKTTIAGQGGYTVSYRPYTGGNATQKNAYKTGAGLCFDCHNNATVGLPTSTGFSTPWGYTATYNSTAKIHGYNDNPYFGKVGGTFARGITFPFIGTGLPTNKGGHFGASSALTTTTNNSMKIGGLCTPCHDPHGVSPGIPAANRQYAVPLLKETFVTSPYKMDAAAVNTTHGGGSKVSGISAAATAGYHIDQNTMQVATTGTPTTALRWNFAASAATLNTLTDTQFAGLCMKCHAKASINSSAAATSANWKTMTRIHNSVKGWASTGGGNAGNTKHAYTCSKCHSAHNSNLPRLLVTNCLDARHKNRSATAVTPSAATIGPFSGSNSSGNGLGRFPGGGASQTNGSESDNLEGAWFFGTLGTAATQACHDSATAGGTFDPAGTSQQWNTKSLW